MRPIPEKMKREILEGSPNLCARRLTFRDHECKGRITLEHALIYAGRQVNEPWAIIKLCAFAHSVDEYQQTGILDKIKNEAIALFAASDEDLAKYPRSNWPHKKAYLLRKFQIA